MKKVSIIIPVYNAEKYLDRCIESMVSQKYRDLEIILIDDGSLDECSKMCDDWAKKDSRIKVIHKKNGGVSSARNVGIKIATGDVITFIDSDDYVTSDFSVALDHLPDDFDVVFCPMILERGEKRKSVKLPLKFGELGSRWRFFRSLNTGRVTSRFYRVDTIKDMRFDETIRFGEDTPFSFNVYLKCDKVFILNIPWYIYNRDNPTSRTRLGYSYKKTLTTLGIIEGLIKLYESAHDISGEKRLFLKKAISVYLFYVLHRCSFLSGKERNTLLLKLKKFKKYMIYGLNFKQDLAKIGIKLIGLKNTSRLIHIYAKLCENGK